MKTLGMGDLSLSHLGFFENNSANSTPTSMKFPDVQEQRGRSQTITKDEAPPRSATAAAVIITDVSSTHIDDVQSIARPRSVYEPSMAEDHTPPNGVFSMESLDLGVAAA